MLTQRENRAVPHPNSHDMSNPEFRRAEGRGQALSAALATIPVSTATPTLASVPSR